MDDIPESKLRELYVFLFYQLVSVCFVVCAWAAHLPPGPCLCFVSNKPTSKPSQLVPCAIFSILANTVNIHSLKHIAGVSWFFPMSAYVIQQPRWPCHLSVPIVLVQGHHSPSPPVSSPKAGTPNPSAQVLTPRLTAPFTAFATHLPPKEAAPTHPLFPFYSSLSLSLTPRDWWLQYILVSSTVLYLSSKRMPIWRGKVIWTKSKRRAVFFQENDPYS